MATMHTAECGECGFTGRYKSGAVAAYALSRHSCATVRARAERAARVKARREDPGVRRDCQHKEANHQHGTRQAYVLDKCRCRPCRTANSEHEAARTKAKAYGRYDVGRVDAQPAREHLAMLAENGISLKRAAELAGAAHSTLGHIVYGRRDRGEGPRKRIERRVADAILAIRPGLDSIPDGRPIDGTGTARRVQALAAIGHSINHQAAAAGLDRQVLDRALDGHRTTAATARAVRALYDRLWDKPAAPTEWHAKVAASRTRNTAARLGWAPPLAWDDDTIDNPHAQPEGHGKDQRHGTAELIEDVHHLRPAGCTAATVAARLGRPQHSIERTLDRAGRHDLASWLRTGNEAAA